MIKFFYLGAGVVFATIALIAALSFGHQLGYVTGIQDGREFQKAVDNLDKGDIK